MTVKDQVSGIGEPMRPGDRFRFSDLGKERLWRTKTQTGLIMRQNREGNSYIVLLDGRKTETTLHHSYIERIKDEGLK